MTRQTTIHIFNPETDYALAAGQHYNPPASIIRLRRKMALFPASFAREGDMILLLDDIKDEELILSPYHAEVTGKGLNIINLRQIAALRLDDSGNRFIIAPWGWNRTLLKTLASAGVPEETMKSVHDTDMLRTLSHRRNVIPIQNMIARTLPGLDVTPAVEFDDIGRAMAFCRSHSSVYFKMPWSSSGRGVLCTSGMDEAKIREWVSGAVRRQGSVMGETAYDRAADFATEWVCRGGKAHFIGLSYFRTTPEGRYSGNEIAPQQYLLDMIRKAAPAFGDEVIEAQKTALEKHVAPHYDGPAGIDMLADTTGRLNPCVEINLRMTMGMAALLKSEPDKLLTCTYYRKQI